MRPRPSCLPRTIFFVVSVFLCAVFLRAADSAKTQFDLPADSAEKSIKRLSEQSGVDVLLPTNLVRDVRTKPVKGEFTAREALDTMLHGTGFVSARDEKSGALTVRREGSDPKGQRAAHPITSDRPAKQLLTLQIQKL